MPACHIIITGKVQGVYYRQTTRDIARKLGVTGFVMNREDGSVFIEATGDESSLHQLAVWCRKGPVLAKVKSVEVAFLEIAPRYSEFEIRR